ncbi:hypothetical protein TPB0596_08520 [Tsukamurella pulmonis]|nr:hypothetical protein TPB0596_08520 [Tsukamurella pulmonis]
MVIGGAMAGWLRRRSRLEWILAVACVVLAVLLGLTTARSIADANRARAADRAEQIERESPRNGLHLVSIDGLRGGTVDQAKTDLKIDSRGNAVGIAAVRGFLIPDPTGDPVSDRVLGPMIVTAACLDQYTKPGPTLYLAVSTPEDYTADVREQALSRSRPLNGRLENLANCRPSYLAVYVNNE